MHAPDFSNALLFLPTHRRPLPDRLPDLVGERAK